MAEARRPGPEPRRSPPSVGLFACAAAAALVLAAVPAAPAAPAPPAAAPPPAAPVAAPLLAKSQGEAEPAEALAGARVDFGAAGGNRTPGLLGVSQVPEDGAVADAMAEDPTPTVRVDAYLDRGLHPAPDEWNFSALDARLEQARRAEAEPVLILAYMPAWMSACPEDGPRDPTRCPPADLQEWHETVEAVAEHAYQEGVTRFEVWNEPDNPLFFQGTLGDYLAMYGAAARAVEDAGEDVGADLQVGGPAVAGPDPAYVQGLLEHARLEGLPVDFVSWHWYANSPFVGDFDHENLPRETPEALDRESPALDPRHYRAFTEAVRSWVTSARLQGLESDPGIWVTEWNVNAGDDPRHRSHEGGAFAAASLAQMEAADLDRAYYFNAQGPSWGMYGPDGEPRPARDAFRLVGDLPDRLVEADAGAYRSHLHVLAATEPGGAEAGLVLANFHGAEPRPLNVTLTVEAAPGPLEGVEDVSAPGENATVEAVGGDDGTRRYRVGMPAQSAAGLTWSAGSG